MGHGGLIVRENFVGANRELMGLVEDYFELSLRTQNLFTSLQGFVRKARDNQIVIARVLTRNEGKVLLSEQDCRGITEELRIVKGELICVEKLQNVYRRHAEMQTQLGIAKTKVGRNFKNYNRLMKGWSIMAALVKRLSTLYVEPLLENVCEEDGWLKSVGRCRSQFLLVEAMNSGTFMGCKEVETMRVFVDRFHCELGRTAKSIEFGERYGDSCALLVCLQDLRNRQPEFLKLLEDFERQTYVCNASISKAQALVSQRLRA
ncbi:hypothetical protein SUGI_0252050 [Cryptomeria japonica]|nr:hypothetical protein SUGI_0252050 [Cryptomeria japonica]